MSVYVMSDIHGHKKELDEMLEKIGFSDEDELYILGDIIDKGLESAEMLKWAVEDAPDNVHFLLGNHEDLAYCSMKRSEGRRYIPQDDPWSWNGGGATLAQLEELFGEDIDGKETTAWICDRMLPWIESLPTHKYLEVDGRPFMLVHAGFDPGMYDSIPEEDKWGDMSCDVNFDKYARNDWEEVGHGFGSQGTQYMLWERKAWHLDENDAPVETIFGHTYFKPELVELYEDCHGMRITGGQGKIAHFRNKHGVDCGCAYAARNPRGNMLGMYALGCLRLDDMREFYVQCREDDHEYIDPW